MPLIDPNGEWMQTKSGKKFHFVNPQPEEIDIVDIAHSLSTKPRFGGHLDRVFTVAQHSLVVSRLCQPQFAFEGLMHDSTEAYYPDILTPIKMRMKSLGFDYNTQIEEVGEKVIFQRFGLQFPLTSEAKYDIKKCDWISVLMEKKLFSDAAVEWEQVPYDKYGLDKTLESYDANLWTRMQKMPPEEVGAAFIQTFKYLARERFGKDCFPRMFDLPPEMEHE